MMDKVSVTPSLNVTNTSVKPKEAPIKKGEVAETRRVIEQQSETFSPPNKQELEKVVKSMNHFLSASNTHLKFQFHDELQEYYVSIVDNVTQEIVREIPPKKLLDMYAAMTDFLGILVDKKI